MLNTASGIEVQANVTSIKITSEKTSIDIITDKTNFFVSASIFCGIFQNLLRMTLVLTDPNDIIKNMKLKGNEDVSITFKKDLKSSNHNHYEFTILIDHSHYQFSILPFFLGK